MSLQRWLRRLEETLIPKPNDLGEPCEVCGAPDTSIVHDGLHMRLVPDEDEDPTCDACGRALDRESGRPIHAQVLVRFVRAQPPEGSRVSLRPSANGRFKGTHL